MTTTLLAAGLAFTSLLLLLSLRRSHRIRGTFRQRLLGHVFRKLETTPGQEQVILSALYGVKSAAAQIKYDLKEARPQLADMMRSSEFDESFARGWMASRERALSDLKPEIIASLKQVHDVLDPEQRKKMGDLLEASERGFIRGYFQQSGQQSCRKSGRHKSGRSACQGPA